MIRVPTAALRLVMYRASQHVNIVQSLNYVGSLHIITVLNLNQGFPVGSAGGVHGWYYAAPPSRGRRCRPAGPLIPRTKLDRPAETWIGCTSAVQGFRIDRSATRTFLEDAGYSLRGS